MSEKKPCWIWFPGDFEIYHSLHLHLRREEHERNYPAFWKLDDCFHNVKFKKEVDIAEPDVMEAFTNGVGYLTINGKKFAYNQKIPLEKGHYTIHAMAAKPDGLPCVYIQSRQCPSDGSWNAYNMGTQEFPAGCTPRFEDISKTPETFPFSYERIYPVDVQEGPDGVLYDFGKETFAKVHLDDIQNHQELNVSYGESIEEARDWERAIIRETVSGVSSCVLKPRPSVIFSFPERTATPALSPPIMNICLWNIRVALPVMMKPSIRSGRPRPIPFISIAGNSSWTVSNATAGYGRATLSKAI